MLNTHHYQDKVSSLIFLTGVPRAHVSICLKIMRSTCFYIICVWHS